MVESGPSPFEVSSKKAGTAYSTKDIGCLDQQTVGIGLNVGRDARVDRPAYKKIAFNDL
jgi:hypothetical protein